MAYKNKQVIGRRGEGHIWITLSAILALVILAFVFYSLFIKTGAPLANFYKNLPGFGQSIPKIKDVEIVRYDLVSREIRFYDGENWNLLKGKAQLNNKEVIADMLNKDFHDYFYDVNKRSTYPVGSFKLSLYDTNLDKKYYYYYKFTREVILNKPVVVIDNDKLIGYGTNDIYSLDGHTLSDDKPLVKIVDKVAVSRLIELAVGWRDSIFKGGANPKAIDLRYNIIDGKTSTPDTKKFCVDKVDEYMIVRLNEPVTSDSECK